MATGRKITVEFIGNDKSLSKTATDVEKRFGKMGGKIERTGSVAGKVLAGGLVAGGALMVKFGQQASDLAETQSKVNQIFGEDGSAALDKFSDGAAKSLGQSKQTALDAAATFGTFGKAAGLAGTDLSDFAIQNDQLASDMASFSNTSPEEAIEALGAAFRGESEPIRKYGVLLDDATLRNEALKLGLVKTTKEALTPQQKVLAAQSAIMKQTTDQQGDFARTSDGLANKQRILKAELANMSTELGSVALPVMVKAVGVGLKMSQWADKHRTLVGALVVTVGTLTAGIWATSKVLKHWVAITKIAKAAQIAFNFVMAANPLGVVILLLAGVAAALYLAYKKSETFRRIVNGAFSAVANGAKAAKDFIVEKFNALVGFFKDLPSRISAKASGMFDGVKNAFKSALNWIIEKWNGLEFSIPSIDTHIPGVGSIGGFSLGTPNIDYFAKGGRSRGGLAVVGEDGPELLNLRAGDRVHSNRASRGMLGGGITIVINGALDPLAVGRQVEQILVKHTRATGRPLQVKTI